MYSQVLEKLCGGLAHRIIVAIITCTLVFKIILSVSKDFGHHSINNDSLGPWRLKMEGTTP